MLDPVRRTVLAALAGVVGLGLMGGTAQAQAKFKAVTTFTVIADMARNVAGDKAIVESITRPDAEIHNYQPTPGDIQKAQDAQLILWNGLNLEQWFERFFRNLKGVPGVVVSQGVEPIGISEGPYRGKPNEPGFVPHVGAALARARGVDSEEIAAWTRANAARVFGVER